MKTEIAKAINFLSDLIRPNLDKEIKNVNMDKITNFYKVLEDLLQLHYKKHWFPESPERGSAYRCLRINHKMDPIILKAGLTCGLDEKILIELLPLELTVWIDPQLVSMRIGENGSISVVFSEINSSLKATPSCPKRDEHASIHSDNLIKQSSPSPAYTPVVSPQICRKL